MERSYSPTTSRSTPPTRSKPSKICKVGQIDILDYRKNRFVGLACGRKKSNIRRRCVHCAFCLNLLKLKQLPILKLLQIDRDEVSLHVCIVNNLFACIYRSLLEVNSLLC